MVLSDKRNKDWDHLQGHIRFGWPALLRSYARALADGDDPEDVAQKLNTMARNMADAGENYRDCKPPFGNEAEKKR